MLTIIAFLIAIYTKASAAWFVVIAGLTALDLILAALKLYIMLSDD